MSKEASTEPSHPVAAFFLGCLVTADAAADRPPASSPFQRKNELNVKRKYVAPTSDDWFHVAVLGATGSVGTAACEVVNHLNRVDGLPSWRVWAASAHRNIGGLSRTISQLDLAPEQLVCSCAESVSTSNAHSELAKQFDVRVGNDELVAVAQSDEVDIVVAAIVGRAGLESTLAATQAGKRVALANKETLVVAGHLVRRAMENSGAELLPVDSEHSAIFQSIGHWGAAKCGIAFDSGTNSSSQSGRDTFAKPSKLILTASGGPFRKWDVDRIAEATPESALAHPTWDMGKKISIDSATMMNKAFEIIEARWLFDFPADSIDVVVHPQSIIHSMVQFDDGSVVSQMSPPDMRLPIQYALTYPRRLPCQTPQLDWAEPWELEFEPADRERFPALELGFEVASVGGTAGAVVNAANEQAVGLFLGGQIGFVDIVTGCRDILRHHEFDSNPSIETLLRLDCWARKEICKRFQVSPSDTF